MKIIRLKIAGVFFAWILFGIMHTLVLSQYIDLNTGVLLIHSLMRSVLFFILSLMLYAVINYSDFSTLSVFQKLQNYSFLAVITVGIWFGLSRLFDFLLFGSETAKTFSKLTAIYIPLGGLLYVIVLQIIIILQYKNQPETDDFQDNEISSTDKECKPAQEEKNEISDRIAVKSNSKIHVILADDIYFLSSDGDYVSIHTENSKYLKEQTMKYFEHSLPANFIRIHRSYIVNSEKISRIELLEKQTYYLILKNSQRIKMSVAGYKMLRQKLAL
jgi:DNA-binding LytR/AlgR family response regulator